MDQATFQGLTRPPRVAWPTVALFFACLTGLGLSSWLAVSGRQPYLSAMVINGLITYFLFSVVHDSAHGAISRHKWLNDALGHIGLFFFGPFAPLNAARWIHMQHHRFTNDHARDPDAFGHRLDWLAPLRWTNFDYFYTRFFLQQAGPVRDKFMRRVVLQIVLVVIIAIAGTALGHGAEVLMLWLLPTRISSALFVTMFVYLPHAPFFATAQQDEYRASNIRAGWEWLLTPLMACQNYHLVHHLYPTAPFYRMRRLWRARLADHLAGNPYFVATFGIGREVPAPDWMLKEARS
jgi:fatty acid desaturase